MLDALEPAQLVCLLNTFMESVKRPYCKRGALVDALDKFSPENPVLPYALVQTEEKPAQPGQQEANEENHQKVEEVEEDHPGETPELECAKFLCKNIYAFYKINKMSIYRFFGVNEF